MTDEPMAAEGIHGYTPPQPRNYRRYQVPPNLRLYHLQKGQAKVSRRAALHYQKFYP